jgi:hypothetical protein
MNIVTLIIIKYCLMSMFSYVIAVYQAAKSQVEFDELLLKPLAVTGAKSSFEYDLYLFDRSPQMN